MLTVHEMNEAALRLCIEAKTLPADTKDVPAFCQRHSLDRLLEAVAKKGKYDMFLLEAGTLLHIGTVPFERTSWEKFVLDSDPQIAVEAVLRVCGRWE